jgi:hypothetical protein
LVETLKLVPGDFNTNHKLCHTPLNGLKAGAGRFDLPACRVQGMVLFPLSTHTL